MAKAFHFHGRRDSETAVRLYLIGPDFVFSRPEKGTAKVKVGDSGDEPVQRLGGSR